MIQPNLSFAGIMTLAVALLLLWAGISILSAVNKIKKTYELTPNRFVYPASCKPDQCKNITGYIQYTFPRLTIFAAAALVLSAFMILQNMTNLFSFLPSWLATRGSVLLFLPLFIWYAFFINQAARRFW